jgi:hypothetical protein
MAYAIESVLRRLDIKAERRGRRLWAMCPRATQREFHPRGDQNPSWFIWGNIVPHKAGLQFCFACKFGGNLVDLVVYMLKLRDDPYPGSSAIDKAKAWLRGEAVEEPPVLSVKIAVRPIRQVSFRLPPEIVFEPLEQWPSPMRNYLIKDRHLTPEQIVRWGIGYAIDGRLGGRVVTVTRNQQKIAVNYSARHIGSSPKRYLMGDARDGADRRVLFGEEYWFEHRGGTIVLTEGAFDALAVERVLPGVAVAALSGSHVNPGIIARLASFTRFVVATDEDAAGEYAARKLSAAFARTATIERVAFPAGQDANSLEPDRLRSLLAVCGMLEERTAS